MDYSKILALVLHLATKINQDMADKKITVRELLELVESGLEDLGLMDKVILDLSKKENGETQQVTK